MLKRVSSLLIVTSCFLASSYSQRSSTQPRLVDIYVNVTWENSRPVGQLYRVQLIGRGGYSVAENYTNDRGQVTFYQQSPGSYRIRVSGPDVEETNSERAFEIQPNSMVHHEYFSVKAKADESQQSSTQAFVTAASLNIPDKARDEFEKGMKAYAKSDAEKAKKHLTKAAEEYPRYADALNALGVLAMNAGQVEEGRGFFQKAIQGDSEHPSAYVNMGRLLMKENKFKEGEPLVAKAVSLNPKDTEALSILSFYQLNLQKFDEAIQTAQRVHMMPHPKYAMVHFVAATAYQQQQRDRQAAAELRLYIKESPPGPVVEKAKATLTTLEARAR